MIEQLNLLVERNGLVKVLLTAHLTKTTTFGVSQELNPWTRKGNIGEHSSTTKLYPHRKLSVNWKQNDMALVAQIYVKIQERRTSTIAYTHLPLIYPVNSVICVKQEGSLQAFVVAELSGMEQCAFNSFSPLRIWVWSVNHNGKHHTKVYQDFQLRQLSGDKLLHYPVYQLVISWTSPRRERNLLPEDSGT